jgi:hypothetical protein
MAVQSMLDNRLKKTTAKQGVNWWNFCNNNAAGLNRKIF